MRKLISILIVFVVIYSGNSGAGTLKDEYELKVQCGQQAEKWFTREYGKNGVLSKHDYIGGGHTDYSNHYNLKLNKCFIEQTLLLNDGATNNEHVWQSISVFDLNEGREYGSFSQNGKSKTIFCSVNGKNCQTQDEFESLIKPFMND